jgi:hypothetical protein
MENRQMKTLILALTALALASPASAQLYPNQFNQALQSYQVDQQMNGLLGQAQQNYQDSFNRGLQAINPRMPAAACTPYNRSMGWC